MNKLKKWWTFVTSPEGPFENRDREPLKRFVRNSAKWLGIDIYGWSLEDRELIAEYVAAPVHRDETLFLVYRLHAETRRISDDGDVEWAGVQYALKRMFGLKGAMMIVDAAEQYRKADLEATRNAVDRAEALVEAWLYDKPDKLRQHPQFPEIEKQGRVWGPRDAPPELQEFCGANYVWFGHIMVDQKLGDWLVANKTSRGVMKAIDKLMRP